MSKTAQVKFICDNFISTVPFNFIKYYHTYDDPSTVVGCEVGVFWSPDADETPASLKKIQGKILDVDEIPECSKKGKSMSPLPGYYRATVLAVADNPDELEGKDKRHLLKRKTDHHDLSKGSKTSISCPQTSSSSVMKSQATKHNITKIVKQQSLFKNQKKSLFGSSDSSSNEDGGVVPEKFHTDLKSKFSKLQSKYDSLKAKHKLVLELNLNLQSKLMKFEKSQKEEPKRDKKDTEKPIKDRESITPNHATISKAGPEIEMEIQMEEKVGGSEMEIQMEEKVGGSFEIQNTFDKAIVSIPKDKIQMASKVKKGEAGDSMFIKNMCMVLWTTEELAASSVTGQRCLAKKGSTPKPALCTNKWRALCDALEERINGEGDGENFNKRMSRIRGFVAEKIVTLNRSSKPPKNSEEKGSNEEV